MLLVIWMFEVWESEIWYASQQNTLFAMLTLDEAKSISIWDMKKLEYEH